MQAAETLLYDIVQVAAAVPLPLLLFDQPEGAVLAQETVFALLAELATTDAVLVVDPVARVQVTVWFAPLFEKVTLLLLAETAVGETPEGPGGP